MDPVLREAEEVARIVTRRYLLGDFGADDALLTLHIAFSLVTQAVRRTA
jgi:hypothetical protein